MDLQFRHLHNLCAVADAGSLNRAAAGLGLPQPALSRQVRRVEELLGGSLFERDTGGIRPTPLGAQVLAHAETVLRLREELDLRLHDQRASQRRALRVGWASGTLAGALLQSLRALRLRESLQIVTAESTAELDGMLRAGELDIALRERGSNNQANCGGTVAEVPFAENPVILVLPQNHRLSTADEILMSDLADERWISNSGPDNCYEWLRRLCGPHGFAPRIAYDIPLFGPRADVVRHQGCVTLVQGFHTPAPGVCHRAPADLRLRVQHSLAFPKESPVAGHVPALAGMLKQAFHRLHGTRPPLSGPFVPEPAPGTLTVTRTGRPGVTAR